MHKPALLLLGALTCSAYAADEIIPLDRPAFGDVPAPKVQAAPSAEPDDAPQPLFAPAPMPLPKDADTLTQAPPPPPEPPQVFLPTPGAAPAPPVVALPLPSRPAPLPPPIRGAYAYAREGAQLRATPSANGRSLVALPSGAVIKRKATLQTSNDRWWQGETEGYGSGWITEREMVGE